MNPVALITMNSLLAGSFTALWANGAGVERQLTTGSHGHVMTNVNVWSPDGEWLVYDVRGGTGFDGARIEQVNLRTGEVRQLFASRNGANCGVVTYSQVEPKVVFILGPESPTPEWNYAFTRRRGVLVDSRSPGVARSLDAMNYAPPFIPGALRGGSHVHVFSPDGRWVSFTYEDELLARLDATPGAPTHETNQRNVGVAVPAGPVRVARSHPRNHDGDWFSVLVTRTVERPRPGSDEISRGCEEAWIGGDGYPRNDGTRQERALAFQGLVTGSDGTGHAELFIVDLPGELTQAGEVPLEGTVLTRPSPPRGVLQRRLTYTSGRNHPGIVTNPRHWPRSSPDGVRIAFLMKDEAGVVQLWTVSPNGGEPRQLTHNPTGVASAFTWSPDGRGIAHVMDGSVCVTDAATGITSRLTPKIHGNAAPSPLACVFSPDGCAIAYTRAVADDAGEYQQIFVVLLPENLPARALPHRT